MHKKIHKKLITVVLSLALCAIGIAGTYALFKNETDSLPNTFTAGQVNVAIMEKGVEHEDFKSNTHGYPKLQKANDKESKVVTVKNKGNMETYVRVMLEASIVNDTNENEILLEEVKVKYTFAENTNWKVDQETNTYYYTDILEKGETSEELLQAVTTLKDIPDGYHLEVKVLTDAIAARPSSNLKDAWNITDFSTMSTINNLK